MKFTIAKNGAYLLKVSARCGGPEGCEQTVTIVTVGASECSGEMQHLLHAEGGWEGDTDSLP